MSSSINQGARRVHLTRDHLADLDKDQLVSKWLQQEAYINQLENAVEELSKQADSMQHELQSNETKYKKRLHNICMKLTLRDRKINQLQEKLDLITQSQLPTPYQLESTLIDPALNMMFEKMKSEMESAKVKVEEMQNELSAWKFTPDSTTGKRLMAKCRLLHNENEELGKEMSTGWVAQLTGNLALQKKFSEEMKKSQSELDEFLLELEEEVEGMQNTIYYLQQQLKEAKEEKREAITNTTSTDQSMTTTTTSTANDNQNTTTTLVSTKSESESPSRVEDKKDGEKSETKLESGLPKDLEQSMELERQTEESPQAVNDDQPPVTIKQEIKEEPEEVKARDSEDVD